MPPWLSLTNLLKYTVCVCVCMEDAPVGASGDVRQLSMLVAASVADALSLGATGGEDSE